MDVGFAFDGDADRCLCVDEKGNVITGDHILYIYGCYMKERGKADIQALLHYELLQILDVDGASIVVRVAPWMVGKKKVKE